MLFSNGLQLHTVLQIANLKHRMEMKMKTCFEELLSFFLSFSPFIDGVRVANMYQFTG